MQVRRSPIQHLPEPQLQPQSLMYQLLRMFMRPPQGARDSNAGERQEQERYRASSLAFLKTALLAPSS